MEITEELIEGWYSAEDYLRGKEYFRQHRVRSYHEEVSRDKLFITCRVIGTENYSVLFYRTDSKVMDECSCPRHQATGSCKHVVAALLEHVSRQHTPAQEEKSDWRALRLLDAYQPGSTGAHIPLSTQRLHLQPVMKGPVQNGEYPTFSFRIGYDRLYVIRNIRDFLDRVESGAQFSYGKNLTVHHHYADFDELSQQIISILQDTLQVYRSVYNNYISYYPDCNIKSEIQLTGSFFDRLFTLLQDQPVSHDDGGRIHMQDGTPALSLRISSRGSRTILEFDGLSDLTWFGAGRQLYVLQNRQLFRCPEDFSRNMRRLLERAGDTMALVPKDFAVFCSCVLPAIRDYMEIEDPDDLLRANAPDRCMSCFYFDQENDTLYCRLAFRYRDLEADYEHDFPVAAGIRRDPMAEQLAVSRLSQYFTRNAVTDRFELTGDDAVFDFLSHALPVFHACGEVFVSDRLQNLELHPSSASVGISVSDGLLHLELDTGGFPPEELEALYQSMLQKRKYHRLRDGRYFELSGSATESLAEAAHMSQLSVEELKSGSVTLPAYRSLYLDAVLDSNDALEISRDQEFRTLVQKFKNIQDQDFPVPEVFSGVLRSYQKTGFRWLKVLESNGFGGILADEMGLGKTLQMITFFSTVPFSKVGKSSLVVCPASLVLNWGDEFQRFAPRLKVTLVLGNAAERHTLLKNSEDSDVLVTSYDLLKRDLSFYTGRCFYCCTLDEGQYIKNQSTQASKAVKQIPCQQRFVLTGTPIENRLSELWNLFDFIMPGYLFSHNRFVAQLEKPIVKSQDAQAQQMLTRLVQPFLLRRLKQDVLKELPPKLEYIRKIALSEEEQKLYYASVLAAKQKLSGTSEKLQILAALTRLRQICCEPALCFENYAGAASKLDACMELISSMTENGHQILVFSQFTSMLELLRQRIYEAGISCYTLQGSTGKEKRAQLVKDFNSGGAQVFLISLKAGGTGLNLTAADVVIHYDPWWNIAAQNQATDRAHRIGQKACVQVYKLIAAGTIEERILELQDRKAQLMDALSAGSDSILSMTQEELLELLDY